MLKKILKTSFFKKNYLFLVTVILPCTLGFLYFGLIASDIYVTESNFVIRSHNKRNSVSDLGALLESTGLSRDREDSYTIHAYITSRDVLPNLNQVLDLKKLYGSSQVDILSRFDPLGLNNTTEELHQYMQKKIIIELDNASGILKLKTKAFDKNTAFVLNGTLLDIGEEFVNKLNERARNDTIGFSERQVQEAEERVKKSSEELYVFRIDNGIFDINTQTEAQLSLISKLQDALISVQTQLTQIQVVTPKNPQIPALKAREKSLQKEIKKQTSKIFGNDNATFSNNASKYERLTLELKLSEQQLVSAITSLEKATNEAQRKQLYLERISEPNKVDYPMEPHRLMNSLATLLVSLLVYAIFRLFIISVKEHQQN